MPTLDRQTYLAVTQGYFDAVTREDFPGVLARFTPAAEVTIFHGDNPAQHFHKAPADGQRPFDEFYGHLWENYVVAFNDRAFVVDAEAGTAAAIFSPSLTPKAGSAYLDTGPLTLNNANFFWFEDGLIARMVIYYANPTLGEALKTQYTHPTPFPRE